MTHHNFDNFSHYFNKWQKNIINFALKRSLVNKELEKYIKSFQIIDSEIYKALFTAKEYYNKKHRYYNQKIKRLKQKEIELKQLLDSVNREKRSLTEPKVKDEISTSIRYIKQSIKEIDDKINNLSNQIEELTLDVDEENNIIEDIKNLDRDKQINLRHLRKLEQDLLREMQHNTYFKTVRTIEILEINLKEIPRNLDKWSKKKVKIHRKMLDLCHKAKVFENIKKQIENELLRAKQAMDRYLQLYSELKNQNKKKLIEEPLRFFKNRAKTKEKRMLNTMYIIKKRD
jgi:DNA repair exonuclease SbcCD ATPase subunit